MNYLLEPTSPLLRQMCRYFPFEDADHDPKELNDLLVSQMLDHDGLGLAAPQIGIMYRAFAFRDDPPGVMFNPVIADVSNTHVELEEACLSVPGIVLKISRPKSVRIRYKTYDGNVNTIKLTGMSARVVQHEIDHLNGVLFIDHVSKVKYKMAKDKARKRGFTSFPKQQEILFRHG